MSGFADDPEAQARYAERFGRPEFREGASRRPYTPSLHRADVPVPRGELEPVGGPAEVTFAEPSELYLRLSRRVREGFGEPVGGVGEAMSEPGAGLGL